MLSAALACLLSCPLFTLRLSEAAGSFPKPLSAQEEQTYIARFLAGDAEARNVLIERNLRLVAHVIKKYYTRTGDQDDLISIGTIGLIKGISTYKPDRGVRLATYASRCIENEILMYFRREKKTAGDVSLSDSIDADGDGGSLSLLDVIHAPDDLFENLSDGETYVRLRRYMAACLTERETEILGLRYGLAGGVPQTQREIARRFGISRSYVSRLEKRALEKIRACFEADDAD